MFSCIAIGYYVILLKKRHERTSYAFRRSCMETALWGDIAVASGDGRMHMASMQVLYTVWQAALPQVANVGDRGWLEGDSPVSASCPQDFLTGANPFVLTVNRLTDIALLIRKYVGEGHPTIGLYSHCPYGTCPQLVLNLSCTCPVLVRELVCEDICCASPTALPIIDCGRNVPSKQDYNQSL